MCVCASVKWCGPIITVAEAAVKVCSVFFDQTVNHLYKSFAIKTQNSPWEIVTLSSKRLQLNQNDELKSSH